MSSELKFPVGVDNYYKLISGGFLCADKTLAIREICHEGEIVVITRPRRFGKTLFMSMLQHFFAEEVHGNATAKLFENSLIAKQHPEIVKQHQGQYSVIFVTFKNLKADNQELAIAQMKGLLSELYLTHNDVLQTNTLDKAEQAVFERMKMKESDVSEMADAIKNLSSYLLKAYGKPVIILIDEYDTPLISAHLHNYYDTFINIMRGMFGAALKGNPNLFKGVITGIVRLAKEGLFSDLNNPSIYTSLNKEYSQYFGFTQTEVDQLLQQTNLTKQSEEIKRWYNGYQIGEQMIYNPWSLINCLKHSSEFLLYWVNTSDNRLIRKYLAQSNDPFKLQLENLIQGGTTKQRIDEHLQFHDLDFNDTALWTLLFYSGYLTAKSATLDSTGQRSCELAIPNRELLLLYRREVTGWFADKIGLAAYERWLESLVTGDMEGFEYPLKRYLLETMSYFDASLKQPERFYHGLVLGLIVSLKDTHRILSNRESGYGRYDIAIIPKEKNKLGIVFEFKTVDKTDDLSAAADKALQQIKTRAYQTEFEAAGIKEILQIGMAFMGKQLEIKHDRVKSN